jgi:hypothetical protein
VPVDPAIRTTHLGHGIFECVLPSAHCKLEFPLRSKCEKTQREQISSAIPHCPDLDMASGYFAERARSGPRAADGIRFHSGEEATTNSAVSVTFDFMEFDMKH